MKFLFRYLWDRKRLILTMLSFVIVFAVSFALYHLPLAAVFYPTLICCGLALLALASDCFRAWQRHRDLCRVATLPATAMEEMLPEAQTQDSRDYQEIVRVLREEQARLENSMNLRYQETVEYYTVWAHQIKTPIASMHLHLQNEDSPLSRRLSSDLFRVEQYVEMVLTFLRLDAPSTDYVFRTYDLDAILRAAVRKFRGEFIVRHLRLNLEPTGQTVVTDEKWLSFVIEQVLSNALKYTPCGSITVCMESPDVLCIRDTGIGIAPEDLPRIFEKGYTGYHGRDDHRASGIGLYLCRRICQNLGYRITADSTPDVGTTVRIDLKKDRMEAE